MPARNACALAAALLLAVVASAPAADAAPGLRGWLRLADDPPSCLTITDAAACESRDDCSWCVNAVLGDLGCLSQDMAEKVPAKVAECSGVAPAPSDSGGDEAAPAIVGRKKHRHDDKPKPKPPASCGDNKEKRDCLHLGAEEGDCAWCAGGFMPDSCLAAQAAKFLPEQVAKCKMQKKKKEADEEAAELTQDGGGDDPAPKPKPPTSCGDNKEKRACLHLGAEEGDCAWCAGDNMPPSCVGVKAAEWIPEQVAKCKLPKKKKNEQEVDAEEDEDEDDEALTTADELARKHRKKKKHDDDSGSGGGWIPGGSGGGWIPGGSGGGKKGGGGWIPGGGSGGDWGPGGKGGAGGGQGCMALKSRKKCLRGTDTEACAWCGAGSFLGSSCVSQQTAQFIPSMISSCEMRKKKKNENEAVAAS